MGTLRLIFTITIILGHIFSIFGFRYCELLTSPIAFESFFLLSGFYITMVWQTDYSKRPDGYKKFMTKRVLRVFPLYWLMLLVTICVSLVTYATLNDSLLLTVAINNWAKLSWTVKAYVLFSNVFIVGQEAIFFVKINYQSGSFAWSQKFIDGNPPLHFFLLVSQAWAISYILYYYFLVPFLNRLGSSLIVILTLILLAARFFWYYMGHYTEPWLYRFFPFEFAFFLLGMLAYRAYKKWSIPLEKYRKIGSALFILFVVMTCAYDFWQVDYLAKQWLYYLALCTLMPLFFSITKNYELDNYLGQLAYPAYMCNFIIIHLIRLSGIQTPWVLILFVLGLTLFVSAFLLKYIVDPLNRFAQLKIGALKRGV